MYVKHIVDIVHVQVCLECMCDMDGSCQECSVEERH